MYDFSIYKIANMWILALPHYTASSSLLFLTHIPISDFKIILKIKSSRISFNTAMNTDSISIRFAEIFCHQNVKYTHNK